VLTHCRQYYTGAQAVPTELLISGYLSQPATAKIDPFVADVPPGVGVADRLATLKSKPRRMGGIGDPFEEAHQRRIETDELPADDQCRGSEAGEANDPRVAGLQTNL
jgi:hypothetical protein